MKHLSYCEYHPLNKPASNRRPQCLCILGNETVRNMVKEYEGDDLQLHRNLRSLAESHERLREICLRLGADPKFVNRDY